jgi:hypothetical protein
MGQSLRELLDAREREVRRTLDDIRRKQVEPLELELAEIVAARRAIGGPSANSSFTGSDEDLDRYKRMKYEDLATLGLREGFPFGATIQELLDHIKLQYGRDIAQGSFSPILSRLRQKGILGKDGHAWVLKEVADAW